MSDDPFDTPDKKPAVSWKSAKVGTVVTGTVTEEPTEVQSRDFSTGELEFWDKNETQPKMNVVVGLNIDGDELNLWMGKPSALFAAVREALKAAAGEGEKALSIRKSGTLKVKYTGDKKTGKGSPARQFKAKYEPPDDTTFDEPDLGNTADADIDDEPPF
jgi:hypothetical protein